MKSLLTVLQKKPLSTILAQTELEVKAAPVDADKRAEWVQLLLLYGDWPRAKAQLKAWQALSPFAAPVTQQLSDAVMAEVQRELVFSGGYIPAFLTPPSKWLSMLVDALSANPQIARELREEVFELATASVGTLSASDSELTHFSWLADADSRLGPVCELFIDNRYYWVPFDNIESISFQAPQNVVHLVWANAMVKWRSGKQQVCLIPSRYPLLDISEDVYRLGGKTDWLPLNDYGHYIGQGQKSWITDGAQHALLTLRQIQFTAGEL